MSYVTAIGLANPPHRFEQGEIADFMIRAMQLNDPDIRKLKAIFHASGIDYRYSVIEDYGLRDNFRFYPNSSDFEPFPSTSKRLTLFREHALGLSVAAVQNMLTKVPDFDLRSITHLITVSCTGLYAPGLDIELVRTLGLLANVQRTGINFMGCYAAFNALKVADAFCAQNRDAKVLIVCTELCSLHFQKTATSDNLISNALFADGSAAVLVQGRAPSGISLVPKAVRSTLIADAEQDMAWAIGDLGFEMRLSTYVPSLIRGGISSLASSVLENTGKDIHDIRFLAIHPGGRKILESVEQELNISAEMNESAYYVLRNFGNMSSPTVLFVLDRIMGKLSVHDKDDLVLSFAFGPGLTLESMLFHIVVA
ncbi:MAG TPA: type III polyketide synthase [Chryseolinea sp.]|nr:type III polyketide synthase [Chryseolinea sp.]